MSLPVVFRPQAEVEIGEAADWYEAQRDWLGDQFIVCVDAAIERVARAPESCVCAW